MDVDSDESVDATTSPLAPYTASKFALEALSEALARSEAATFNTRR
jgi:NAD(P)-dependent dehydrogenase (short-subunit alcohol dehydrogenase family)